MTLDELYNTLPNGLHDAMVHSFTVDYSKRQARFIISVWVGDLESKDEEAREEYRGGELVLYDVDFFIVETPDPAYPYHGTSNITIDTGNVESLSQPPAVVLPPIQESMHINWIYVFEWNSFIYVASRSAKLHWNDEA
ncbi:MAG: hypothetical protein D3916_02335 [Candidatus Electrothrix sp. MAN1_4]|nr:hypothetical protein [Candidatus Electrothrix sp. MAN1_4]